MRVILVALFTLLWAFVGSVYAGEASSSDFLRTFTVEKRSIPEWSEYPGVVGSRNYVDVIPQVTGRIRAVHVHVGQEVKKGDALLELDSPGGTVFITSPMNGTIINKRVNPGDFAMPGLPANLGYPAGRILMSIYDPKALWFEANIPERFSEQVKVGRKAVITIESANLTVENNFVEVQPMVDDNARIFVARVDLPALSSLKMGMFGRAKFVSGTHTALMIPENAVIERGQLNAVFLLSDDHARLRLVRLGKKNQGKIEILSGLNPGEKVILNPAKDLQDADPVVLH